MKKIAGAILGRATTIAIAKIGDGFALTLQLRPAGGEAGNTTTVFEDADPVVVLKAAIKLREKTGLGVSVPEVVVEAMAQDAT